MDKASRISLPHLCDVFQWYNPPQPERSVDRTGNDGMVADHTHGYIMSACLMLWRSFHTNTQTNLCYPHHLKFAQFLEIGLSPNLLHIGSSCTIETCILQCDINSFIHDSYWTTQFYVHSMYSSIFIIINGNSALKLRNCSIKRYCQTMNVKCTNSTWHNGKQTLLLRIFIFIV